MTTTEERERLAALDLILQAWDDPGPQLAELVTMKYHQRRLE